MVQFYSSLGINSISEQYLYNCYGTCTITSLHVPIMSVLLAVHEYLLSLEFQSTDKN